MIEAGYLHSDAIWAAGSINHNVAESVSQATYKVKASVTNVAGVKIPKFERAGERRPCFHFRLFCDVFFYRAPCARARSVDPSIIHARITLAYGQNTTRNNNYNNDNPTQK